jgi:cytochrome c oxidase cbb3-type subunit 3
VSSSLSKTLEIRCAILAVFALAIAVGCVPPGKPSEADRPVMPSQIMGFEQLFSTNCAACHGADGKLGPAPPLNDPLFLTIVPDDVLLDVIRNGRDGTPMPAFLIENGGSLTQEQVQAIADGLKPHWKSDEQFGSPPQYLLPRGDDQQSSTGSAERGKAVFARACAGCHGPDGQGGEKKEGGAINLRGFLALISDQAIRRIIITGRPDLGMPTYAETKGRAADFKPLTSAEIDDLVALMAGWRTADMVVQSDGR